VFTLSKVQKERYNVSLELKKRLFISKIQKSREYQSLWRRREGTVLGPDDLRERKSKEKERALV
jgi:hypothetical protein